MHIHTPTLLSTSYWSCSHFSHNVVNVVEDFSFSNVGHVDICQRPHRNTFFLRPFLFGSREGIPVARQETALEFWVCGCICLVFSALAEYAFILWNMVRLKRKHRTRHLLKSWDFTKCRKCLSYREQVTVARMQPSLYRDRLKGLYVVGRNFFLLLLDFSAWPCLGPA